MSRPPCRSCPWFRSQADCPACAKWTPPPPVTVLDRVGEGVSATLQVGLTLAFGLFVLFAVFFTLAQL